MIYTFLIDFFLGNSVFDLILCQLKKYTITSVYKCSSKINGLTIIVTGATTLIGKATALELAQRGAHVILACKNLKLANTICKEIKSLTGNERVSVKYLDLMSLKTIKYFSIDIHKEYKEIFGLINIAEVLYQNKDVTVDGFNSVLQINFISAYFLTYLLVDLLTKSKSAKIINIPSQCHYIPKFRDVEEIIGNHTLKRCHIKTISVSKLALLAFTFHLAEELKETNVSVYAVDPGNCEKQIFPNFPKITNPILFVLNTPIHAFILKSALDGAQCIIHTLLSDFPTGSFILDYQRVPFSSLAKNNHLFNLLQENIIKSCKSSSSPFL